MRVLIGYDGSKLADAALRDLHRAGLPPDVEATVLCAADAFVTPPSLDEAAFGQTHLVPAMDRWSDRMEQTLRDARAHAERGAAFLRSAFPGWSVSAEATADSPGWAILERAEENGPRSADLILVGASGHSAIGRLFLGSVSHKVLVNARRTIRIGRERPGSSDKPIRLLVGVDGSEDSKAAVSAVARRTWPSDTQCSVVIVEDFRMRMSVAVGEPPLLPESYARRLAEESTKVLTAVGLKASALIREDEPARCLVEEAEKLGADCIFVGARGLGRVSRFMLGSVSTSVAMRASCSVEVIHL